jgi:enoyl-CoA hydratase/carnithine racemase
MAESEVLDARAAAALLALSVDEVGPAAGRPVVVVALDDTGATVSVGEAVAVTPALVVGVLGSDPVAAEVLAGFDLVVAQSDRFGGEVPRSVVAVEDLDEALASVVGPATAHGAATLGLAQLLRAGEHLPLATAVVAESWVYSMLQAGPDHQAWSVDRTHRAHRPAEGDPVRATRMDGRLDVTLARPHVRNAVDRALRDGLHDALAVAGADPAVTEVHLWGEGPSFCSGGDLGEFGTMPDPVTAHVVRTTRSPALGLTACRHRLVAHVQGAAVGAGAEWSAFARRVIARDDAVFALPELAMGLVPGAGGTASIPRRIGRQRTAWLAVTGRSVDASAAHRWGLVDEVVDDVTFGAASGATSDAP